MCTLPEALGQLECMTTEAAERQQCLESRGLQLTLMPNTVDVLDPQYTSLHVGLTFLDPQTVCA
jgi:hypothetical protein